ncbi:MAG: hypothetical protein KJZ78_29600, partial [Bryobacteraceae bacterium]|nr:hypothetical protein [Bryobacteraceae bacterium]
MHFSSPPAARRGFLRRLLTLGGFSAAAPAASLAQNQPAQAPQFDYLPRYARALHYQSWKQSSFDQTGGNSDRWPIKP